MQLTRIPEERTVIKPAYYTAEMSTKERTMIFNALRYYSAAAEMNTAVRVDLDRLIRSMTDIKEAM